MRTASSLLLLAASALQIAVNVDGHPLCWIGDRPTDYEEVLEFCPEQPEGACCTDDEELGVQALFEAAGAITGECADLYKETVCGICNSYSAHLYAELAGELGVSDGLMMKKDFCESLVTACEGQLMFPDYDGEDYCSKHTGGGANDQYWSYPYEEVEVPVGLQEYFEGNGDLPADALVMAMTPQGDYWWIGGRAGQMVKVSVDDLSSGELVLDLTDSGIFYDAFEEGLLGFAFSPVYGVDNTRFYVAWNIGTEGEVINRLSMFEESATPAATLASEEILVESGIRSTSIHAGGWVGFKPSDYGSGSEHDLYWAIGDGGPQEDPEQHGQNIDNIHATIVRITVPASGSGFDIPSGNIVGGRPEICAYGFRNPWRCGFDRLTDVLYCGDVGHTDVESVKIVECGQNHGWGRFEGSLCQAAAEDWAGDCADADRSGITFPYYEYCHPDYDSASDLDKYTGGVDFCAETALRGHAVIGGYVYRGQYFEEVLGGAYVFGDSQNKNVYSLKEVDGGLKVSTIIGDGSLSIISFAEDINGELFVIDKNWKIYQLPCGDLCASTCLVQTDSSPDFDRLGCYADDAKNRVLSVQSAPTCPEGERAMSPQICADYCATVEGAETFGVEFSWQCFCGAGDDYTRIGELDDAECNFLCTAFPEITCGGNSAVEVYVITDVAPTPAPVAIVTQLPAVIVDEPLPGTPTEDTPSPVSVEETPAPVSVEQPTPATGDYAYVGCYADSSSARVLTLDSTKGDPTMTADVCSEFCAGSTYFGTEFGTECFCGADTDTPEEAAEATNCDVPCAGDATENCGGKNAVSLYEFGGVSPPTPSPVDSEPPTPTTSGYDSVGCVTDSPAARVLSLKSIKKQPDMTADLCYGYCQGSLYFGTEFGSECFCGADTDTPEEAPASTNCDMACSGDADETCGGRNALNLYLGDGAIVEGYLGCWTDVTTDRIFGDKLSDATMTIETCATHCDGNAYYGVQYGSECFCGAADADFTKHGESSACSFSCAGNSLQTCGGKNAMSVYEY